MKHFLLSTAALILFTARAQANVGANTADLILGFRASGGQGADTNLEVNLGPAANFYGAAAGSASVLTGLSVEDLKSTYGNDWATRADLFWGVVGATTSAAVGAAPARTLWATRAEAIAGTASTPWPRGVQFTLQIPSGAISTMYTGAPGSITSFPATANSATAAKVNAGEGGSWSVQDDATPGVSFKYFNPTVVKPINTFPAAGSAYDGTAYTVLDLWEVRPGTAGSPSTLVGGFGLNSAGKLVFSRDITKFAPATTPVVLGQPTITYSGIGSATISLTNVPSGSFILERSTSMAAQSWGTLFTQSPVAGTLTFIDPSPPQPRGFYRISTAPIP